MQPKERFDYSAIVDRKPLRLPGDARVAVSTVVNVENWDFNARIPRQVMTTPAGASALPDVPNWAWHEYGMRVGFWRLKAALERFDVRVTASINASVCLEYPRIAEAIRDAGWEFMGHGFSQRVMHALDDERAAIVKSIETIRDFTGRAPRGWLGPGLQETAETLDILAEEGIEYICDWVMDEQPCVMKTRAGSIVMVPYSVELNDISIMIIQHHEARVLYERTMAQFERLYQDGKESARVLAICVHPYVTGVPHRIEAFERIFEELSQRPGVLFWTNEEILDWYRDAG
ncbi:MAG: polysaccharide deacetylase family protein [Rhodospirillales bacterium]|jgi:peptidoglycan/xylan/chitin deacetylase (PgdA/CDA1 family)|nr:polysaccharide deacetylase family protein [Rhodospirillales bacterium]MDP6803910.1 polysaccharide deacetylase family protein [Rhodospirillales bacterium]